MLKTLVMITVVVAAIVFLWAAITAGLAAILAWAWNLFAPTFSLQPLTFWPAFGIVVVLEIIGTVLGRIRK
jgi:hypothetical protein